MYMCMYVYGHVCMCACMYVCMYVCCMYVCMYVYMYVCVDVCMCACMYMCMYVHMLLLCCHTSNKCKALNGEGRCMRERERRYVLTNTRYPSIVRLHCSTHCPSLAEDLIQY